MNIPIFDGPVAALEKVQLAALVLRHEKVREALAHPCELGETTIRVAPYTFAFITWKRARVSIVVEVFDDDDEA